MGDYHAMAGLHEIAKDICKSEPQIGENVNAVGPKIINYAVTTMTGSKEAGLAADAAATLAARNAPEGTAEFLTGLAMIPVVMVASPFVVAAAIFGAFFGDSKK